MYRVEIYIRIKRIITVFQYLRWWNFDEETTGLRLLKSFLFLYYASCPVSLLAGAVITEDREESVSLTAVGISVAVHAVRLFYIIYRRSYILMFIQVGSFSIEEEKEFNRVNKKLENFVKFAQYFLFLILISLFLLIFTFAREGRLIKGFNIGFPLDYKNSRTAFWIAFTYLAVQAVYCVVICLLNVTIWYLMFIFSIKYQVLGNQVSRLGKSLEMETETKRKKKNLSEEQKMIFFHRDLIGVIESHKKISE